MVSMTSRDKEDSDYALPSVGSESRTLRSGGRRQAPDRRSVGLLVIVGLLAAGYYPITRSYVAQSNDLLAMHARVALLLQQQAATSDYARQVVEREARVRREVLTDSWMYTQKVVAILDDNPLPSLGITR